MRRPRPGLVSLAVRSRAHRVRDWAVSRRAGAGCESDLERRRLTSRRCRVTTGRLLPPPPSPPRPSRLGWRPRSTDADREDTDGDERRGAGTTGNASRRSSDELVPAARDVSRLEPRPFDRPDIFYSMGGVDNSWRDIDDEVGLAAGGIKQARSGLSVWAKAMPHQVVKCFFAFLQSLRSIAAKIVKAYL